MGAKFGGDDDMISDINITPFVDIILVVLIIFMVTATTIAKQSIQVELPEASTGEATDVTSLGLTLTADGQLLLDGKSVTPEQLTVELDRAKKNDTVTLISADKSVTHGRVVWLIDLVRSRGIHKFAINIDEATKVAPAGTATP
jgi:biopolymer transport protein ExbD